MTVRECDRCHARTKAGRRCSRKTCKIARFCFTHLRTEKGLVVKPSTVRGAGQGLFTAKGKTFKKGDLIDVYAGTELRKNRRGEPRGALFDKETNELVYEGHELGPYVFESTNSNYFIDAISTQSCVARYINGCDAAIGLQARCNAHVVADRKKNVPGPVKKRLKVYATKAIGENSEIFIKYENEYWQGPEFDHIRVN